MLTSDSARTSSPLYSFSEAAHTSHLAGASVGTAASVKSTVSDKQYFKKNCRLAVYYSSLIFSVSNQFIGPQYITPAIFIALLFGAGMVFTAFVALSQMLAIEAPVRFTSTKLILGKVDDATK